MKLSNLLQDTGKGTFPEPIFLNFHGAQESIPQAYVARARICKPILGLLNRRQIRALAGRNDPILSNPHRLFKNFSTYIHHENFFHICIMKRKSFIFVESGGEGKGEEGSSFRHKREIFSYLEFFSSKEVLKI
jgi:hypothetical protein